MKTERRHELQNNDLLEWAGKYVKDVEPHAKTIVGIAIIVAVGLLAMMFMRQRGKASAERSWTGYFAAVGQSDLEGLHEVAKKYPGTAAGAWAMQSAADINLATGTVNMYTDRAEALERLKSAQNDYQQAQERAKSDLLKQRSMMGLAQTHEALNEFEHAEGIYDEVINSWPDTAIAKLAGDRLSVLRNPETKQFYDWFMAQDIQPPADPLGGMQIKAPSIYDDLPSDPNLSMPTADSLLDERSMEPPEEAVDETPVPDIPDAEMLDGADEADDEVIEEAIDEAVEAATEQTSVPE
jgi:tetratricopeptide (TPR) repeat protein